MAPTSDIEVVGRSRFSEAVAVLCDAFFDYPVMRFVIGEVSEGGNPRQGYAQRLHRLVSFFTMARVLRQDLVLPVAERRRLVAVANVNLPGDEPLLDSRLGGGTPWVAQPHAELEEHRRVLWEHLGEAARRRYEAYGRATAHFAWPEPHFHLGMIGALRSHTGRGLGRRLLEHLHEMSRAHRASRGVSLTTEDASNLPLYRRFGYEVVGHQRIGEIESWALRGSGDRDGTDRAGARRAGRPSRAGHHRQPEVAEVLRPRDPPRLRLQSFGGRAPGSDMTAAHARVPAHETRTGPR